MNKLVPLSHIASLPGSKTAGQTVYKSGAPQAEDSEAEVKERRARIGKLAVENNFCHKG